MSLPTLPSPSAPTASYTASCHCGAFTYTVTTSPPLDAADAVIKQCNCSICAKNGYMFIYVPNERIVFEKGGLEEFKEAGEVEIVGEEKRRKRLIWSLLLRGVRVILYVAVERRGFYAGDYGHQCAYVAGCGFGGGEGGFAGWEEFLRGVGFGKGMGMMLLGDKEWH
ncbi:hypothetical protein GGP41_005125 [Bipolaris sorokiniana]|uniref:CENP-V/GFA domain-containing protein n=1 Tax=Cochliobolus sativus TaxID=45130 RepID=A0A8H5ZL16_COCSA|nr:hypothetical protein GGP41_005125 [Bipolaris sorokiniana]